jgi:hypothetical protein
MMPALETIPSQLDGVQRRAVLVGGIGAAVCVIGGLLSPEQFFRSYLVAYVFWIGIALGCMALVMLQHLTGGAWGLVIRRLLEAGTGTLPWMALLFLPLAVGLRHVFVWARPEVVAADPILLHKSPYLNVPFFLARAALYFAIWCSWSYLLNRLSVEQDRTGDARITRKLQLLSGPGIVLYVLTMTFASVDWVMSLEPHWFSTIFGVLLVAGQTLGAFALAITALILLARYNPLQEAVSGNHLHDLGKLMLAFVMVWAYFSFSQFLIIWSGNLPEEIPWYLRRMTGGWQWVALSLIVFHFALPFVLLLSRSLKRSRTLLIRVAALVFAMRLLDTFWMTIPAFHEGALRLHWMDLATTISLGGIFMALCVRRLKQSPLLPVRDPYLKEALSHAE